MARIVLWRMAVNTHIVPLQSANSPEAGGKAQGLSRLLRMGLHVPPGFVVIGASEMDFPDGLETAYRELGEGAVAVRSSAAEEDGAESSYAGQLDTVLGVDGEDALRRAVSRCVASFDSARVRAYSKSAGGTNGQGMAVVVQRMVDAQVAGVVFTADPVTSDRSHIVIDAISGIGEALVSGQMTPDHFVVDRLEGKLLESEPAGDSSVLSESHLKMLTGEALRAEAEWGGVPLDLEWALDHDGTLYWLQARPITTLEDEEGDLAPTGEATDIFTTANIGEMMPGAVNPLTVTTTFWAVDQGIQEMQASFGGHDRRRPEFVFISLYHGHLFFNLTAMADCGRHVAGQSPDTLSLAICGRTVPELDVGPRARRSKQAWNALRYVRYVAGGPRQLRQYEPRVAAFRIDRGATPKSAYQAIDAARPFLFETTHMHLRSSAGSGALIGVIQGILTRGNQPTPEDESALIAMLANATGVESAELVSDLSRVVDAINTNPKRASEIKTMSTEEALEWLQGAEARHAGALFSRFLERHGHRAYREADLSQLAWRDDPRPLVRSIQTAISNRPVGNGHRASKTEETKVPLDKRVPKWLIRYTRSTVRHRERSKSMMISVVDEFKGAYRRLAQLLVAKGMLDDEALIYFLTHKEIGQIVDDAHQGLRRKAIARRRSFGRYQSLEFDDVSIGPPRPIELSSDEMQSDEALHGRPASHGRAEGFARVVRTLDEAAAIEAGDILVAPVTDVGWTPYFGLIGGLATDVGSPISHGAVVAREYGLPAVVNLRRATRAIKTGDRVLIDGTRGTLRVVKD